VPQLALGGRDEKGVLRRVHLVEVTQLPELSARAGQPWDANALLRFGDECLAWMAAAAARAGAAGGGALRFTHDPARGAVVAAPAPGGGGMAARVREAIARGAARAAGGGGGDGGGDGGAV
jgi:hypothetical protein